VAAPDRYPPSQIGEIKALAGVDFLTISPSLLEELKKSTDPVPKKLDAHAGPSPSPHA
jgi:transaldolase